MANTIRKRSIFWKSILTFFPTLILLTSFQQNSDQKYWDKPSPLTWEDFQQVNKTEDYGNAHGANTFVGELYRYKKFGSDSNTYVFAFKVASVMIRSRSHVDPGYKTPALLAHEQLHFDISEYFARQLLSAFQKGTYTKNYDNEIKEIKHSLLVQRNAMTKVYDEQTNYSRNTQMQSKWNIYVQSLLDNNENLQDALKRMP